MPCSLDMRERRVACSSVTATTLSATSAAPNPAPNRASVTSSAGRPVACVASSSAAPAVTSAVTATPRGPCRARTPRAKGRTSTLPSVTPSSESPSSTSERPSASLTSGIRVTQVPIRTPFVRKSAATPARAGRTEVAGRGAAPSVTSAGSRMARSPGFRAQGGRCGGHERTGLPGRESGWSDAVPREGSSQPTGRAWGTWRRCPVSEGSRGVPRSPPPPPRAGPSD